MKRSGPLKRLTPLKSTTPISKVSKKRQRLNNERRKVVKQLFGTRKTCEAGPRIRNVDQVHRCQVVPSDVHEPLTRARGGSIVDPNNMLVVCRACHDWIHHHPKDASSVGLLVSSYKG